jgi:hypothetical protein
LTSSVNKYTFLLFFLFISLADRDDDGDEEDDDDNSNVAGEEFLKSLVMYQW